jgi:hypothetical protein
MTSELTEFLLFLARAHAFAATPVDAMKAT